MPFVLIKGSYHLVGKRGASPSGFQPDGDSMQFKPKKPSLLDRLERAGQPYRLTSIGSTQLRFEGIDALELHFGGSHQPRPLADNSRDYLTGLLHLNPVSYRAPDQITVLPPAAHDGAKGFILSRSLEAHGRPVAFAFAGEPSQADGSEVVLTPTLLRKSLNYRSLARGYSYPLFYDTLFGDLRSEFIKATIAARETDRGIWAADLSMSGCTARDQDDLEQHGVVFPKLFRRLTSYLATGATSIDGFPDWLKHDDEQVLDLTTGNFTHFDNVLKLTRKKIRLIQQPETLVFVSAKTSSPAVAPWLVH